MDCREFQGNHPGLTEPGRAHLAACPDCQAFARAWRVLGEYPPIEPRPGFLSAIYRKLTPRILRFAAPVAAAAAALLVVLLVGHRSGPSVTDDERELVENLDLLENYDILKDLEFVRDAKSPILEEKR